MPQMTRREAAAEFGKCPQCGSKTTATTPAPDSPLSVYGCTKVSCLAGTIAFVEYVD